MNRDPYHWIVSDVLSQGNALASNTYGVDFFCQTPRHHTHSNYIDPHTGQVKIFDILGEVQSANSFEEQIRRNGDQVVSSDLSLSTVG
jgi:hypothetical protein